MLNAYEVFGLSDQANEVEIRRAYRQKIRLLHPDYFGDDAVELFLEAEDAFRILRNERLRNMFSNLKLFSERLKFTPKEVDQTTSLVLKNFSQLDRRSH